MPGGNTRHSFTMSERPLIKLDPGHPRQCKAVHADQQCPFQQIEGNDYCPRHAGSTLKKEEKANIRLYNLARWHAEFERNLEHPQKKSLTEEVALLRVCLQDIWRRCEDSDKLLLYTPKISELVRDIDKLMLSCHKLEASSGEMLDKTRLLQFAGEVVSIVGEHVKDPATLDKIATGLVEKIK